MSREYDAEADGRITVTEANRITKEVNRELREVEMAVRAARGYGQVQERLSRR